MEGLPWRESLAMLAMLAMLVAGLHFLGFAQYAAGGLVTGTILTVLVRGRWKTEESSKKILTWSIVWPLTVLLLWVIIRREERWRKERIIREVMET